LPHHLVYQRRDARGKEKRIKEGHECDLIRLFFVAKAENGKLLAFLPDGS
jgi:hypothetical protein